MALQVLGNALGVFGTAISVMIFQNPVTRAGLCGYCITIAGVGLFVYEKRKGSTSAANQALLREETQPLLNGGKEPLTVVGT